MNRLCMLGAWCLVFLAGCVKDRVAPFETEDGVAVQVSLQLKVANLTAPESKGGSANPAASFSVDFDTVATASASRSDGTTTLYNLWIFQFDASGATRKVVKIPNTPAPVKDMVVIDAELFTGTNQTLYLVALGKAYESVDLSSVGTKAQLEEYPLEALKYVDGVAAPAVQKEEDMPYCGSVDRLQIVQFETGGRGYIKYDETTDFSGAIPLRAMLAKVTFSFTYTADKFTADMVSLNNYPTHIPIKPSDSYRPMSLTNLGLTSLTAADVVGGRYVCTWYLPPNPQGVVGSITTQSDRYLYFNPPGQAPSDGSYINLWAKPESGNNNALYYLYLGRNNTNDFNIDPNSHYTVRTDFNTPPNTNDRRVVFQPMAETINFACSTAPPAYKSIGIKPDYDFDAHPDKRPMELMVLGGTVQIDILETQDAPNPIDPSHSWLKLSAYPNYTEAYNRAQSGDPQGLASSLTVQTNTPRKMAFTLYCDEYEQYTTSNPNTASFKRSLFVRFRITSSTGVQKEYIARMDQRPAFFLGQFGGERDPNTGVYNQGLAYEAIDETTTDKGNYLPYYPSFFILPRGHYLNLTYSEVIALYKADNVVNGKEVTRLLAENKPGKVLFSNKEYPAQTPRWVNGKPDLYQYKYYTKDGFTARWCYDRNRDSNGNGLIDDNEMVWYMPAHYQSVFNVFNWFSNNTAAYKSVMRYDDKIHVTTMTGAAEAYKNSNSSFNASDAGMLTTANKSRCVRDVKLPVALPAGEQASTGPKVEVDGQGYAVIDASGFVEGATVEKRAGDAYIRPDGRNVRHLSSAFGTETLSSKVSTRFRVAPYDINAAGQEIQETSNDARMTWAEAAGFSTAGNSLAFDLPLDPAETGCAAYAGKSGLAHDPSLGIWRLPTVSEMWLIDMMHDALFFTQPQTEFKPLNLAMLSNHPPSRVYSRYWSSTEAGSASSIAFIDWCTYSGSSIFDHPKYSGNAIKGQETVSVRCIQDLPRK